MFIKLPKIVSHDKYHLILSSPEENAAIQMEESRIKSSKVKKPLEIHIDYKLKFDSHVILFAKKLTENYLQFQE